MNNEPIKNAQVYNDVTSLSPAFVNSNNTLSTGASTVGIGSILYHLYSTHYKSILFATETTSLQFYDHVVIATLTTQLWCFPKQCQSIVIPRFKIVNAAFTLGPKSIPMAFWVLLLTSLILIIIGVVDGGCSDDYYSSSGSCAAVVIGSLLLVIPIPLLLLVPCLIKHQYIYLDVRTPRTKIFHWFGIGGITTYAYRFKKVGFDHSTDDKAAFDQFYLIDYVYGSLGKGGNEVTSEAHLLSHYSYATLANPILPIEANNERMFPNLLRRKMHVSSAHIEEASPFCPNHAVVEV